MISIGLTEHSCHWYIPQQSQLHSLKSPICLSLEGSKYHQNSRNSEKEISTGQWLFSRLAFLEWPVSELLRSTVVVCLVFLILTQSKLLQSMALPSERRTCAICANTDSSDICTVRRTGQFSASQTQFLLLWAHLAKCQEKQLEQLPLNFCLLSSSDTIVPCTSIGFFLKELFSLQEFYQWLSTKRSKLWYRTTCGKKKSHYLWGNTI